MASPIPANEAISKLLTLQESLRLLDLPLFVKSNFQKNPDFLKNFEPRDLKPNCSERPSLSSRAYIDTGPIIPVFHTFFKNYLTFCYVRDYAYNHNQCRKFFYNNLLALCFLCVLCVLCGYLSFYISVPCVLCGKKRPC